VTGRANRRALFGRPLDPARALLWISVVLCAAPAGAAPELASDPAMTVSIAAARVSVRDSTSRRPIVARSDLWYAVLGGAAVTAVAFNDRWLTEESIEAHSPGERRLERVAQPLGNTGVMLPAIAILYGAGRLTGRRGLSATAARIGVCIAGTGVGALVLKEVVGRARPDESPADARDLKPFSSQQSFPSGHTAIAFALATGLRRETSAAWVPWVAYPVASLVGWSRVHADEHWTSDVVAGAVLGIWSGETLDALCRSQHRFRFLVSYRGPREGSRAGVSATF